MTVFPDLSRYDRFSVDTETKGEGRLVVPVGASISTPDGQDHYLRWGHQEGGNNCSLAQFIAWARQEFKRPDQTCVMFHALYDMRGFKNLGIDIGAVVEDAGTIYALLNEYEPKRGLGDYGLKYLGRSKSDEKLNKYCAEKFGGRPTRDHQAKNYWRASGDVVEEYAKDDSRLTLDLFDLRRDEIIKEGLQRVFQTETMLLQVLHRMYFAGVKIDRKEALRVKKKLDQEYQKLKKEWDRISGGFKFTERNNMQKLFDELGIEYPRNEPTAKMLAKGITVGNPCFDKHALAAIDHPVGQLITRMRQVTHYRDTFVQGYLLDNMDQFDMIFPNFHPTPSMFGGAITGRFSSSGGLNAQNIPARDEEWAPLIRGMFIPVDEDHDWLKSDMSQIEYRFFAHYAGGKLRQAYLDDPDTDFHQFVIDLTGLSRKRAKNTNFAKLYGAGLETFAKTASLSLDEAEEVMRIYDAKIPEANRMFRKSMNRASARGYITTWGGRKLRFPSVGKFRKKFIMTNKALNKLLQGSSADQIKESMIAVDQVIDWDDCRMHLTVHDELDFSVPKGDLGIKYGKLIKEAMEDHECTVPLKAEVKIGRNWAHAETQPSLEHNWRQAA